jgi:hypothetical protein
VEASAEHDALAYERATRTRAGIAALVAGIVPLVGAAIVTLSLSGGPAAPVLRTLQERLGPGGEQEPGVLARQVLFLDDQAPLLILGAVLTALAAAATGYALAFLFRATRARRPDTPRAAIVATVIGAVTVAVGSLVFTGARVLDTAGFAGSDDQSSAAARDVLNSQEALIGALTRQTGLLALGLAFIFLSLNAMRAGLLTRFMGILGVIVGVFALLEGLSGGASFVSSPIVQAFWLIALGALFLGRTPSGVPPAWEAGVAVPWPSQQELREQRDRERAEGGSAPPRASEPSVAEDEPDAPRRKKRKRR